MKTTPSGFLLFEMKDENSILCLCSASSLSQGQLKSISMTSDSVVELNEQSFDSEHSLKTVTVTTS